MVGKIKGDSLIMFANFKNTGMILKVRKSVIFSYVGSYVYKEIVHNFRYFTLFKYIFTFR